MSRCGKKTNRITISLTSNDHKELEAIAEDKDVSLAWVVRRAVSEYLAKHPIEDNIDHVPKDTA